MNKTNSIIVVLFLLFVSLACENPDSNRAANDAVANAAPIIIDPAELTRAYDENEITADGKYKERRLQVSGTITNIAEAMGKMTVELEGRKENGINSGSVRCAFEDSEKESIAELRKGQNVTFIGTGDGKTPGFFVGLKNCKIQ